MLIAIAALVMFVYLYNAMTNANEKAKEIFTKTPKMKVTDIIKVEHKTAEEWQNLEIIKVLNVLKIDDQWSEVIFEYDIRETKYIFWQMYKWGQYSGLDQFRDKIITKTTNDATAY